MRARLILLVLLLSGVFIILAAVSVGNYNASKPAVADGNPFPPIPPNPLTRAGWMLA